MGTPMFTPFAHLTPRLLILPIPFAVKIPAYRALYSHVNSLPEFLHHSFWAQLRMSCKRRCWNRSLDWQRNRKELERAWLNIVRWLCSRTLQWGFWSRASNIWARFIKYWSQASRWSRVWGGRTILWRGEVGWTGYVGVWDAIPLLAARIADDAELLPWQEMVELRYGYAPGAQGNGYGTEAASALMLWAEQSGVRCFIAETEMKNTGSGKVLGKLGFVKRDGNDFWKDPLKFEWIRKV